MIKALYIGKIELNDITAEGTGYCIMKNVSLKARGASPCGGVKKSRMQIIAEDLKRNRLVYLMVLPVLLYYMLFCYLPMVGIGIAFKDYTVTKLGNSFIQNLIESRSVGLRYFKEFFTSASFGQIMTNTLKISLVSIVFGFPAPIILALLMNELGTPKFKRCVQTLTYLPHFISLVVICGMIKMFTNEGGIISLAWAAFTGSEPVNMMLYPEMFVPIYVISDIWQEMGWGSIIYLSALTGVSRELYEAAAIDGAGRWKQTIHVTLPCIMPTIAIMLILRLGNILNVGYEKIILLYNDLTRPAAEVISTYVYEKGLLDRNYGFSTAVGLFNSVVNIVFLAGSNALSRKFSEVSLW